LRALLRDHRDAREPPGEGGDDQILGLDIGGARRGAVGLQAMGAGAPMIAAQDLARRAGDLGERGGNPLALRPRNRRRARHGSSQDLHECPSGPPMSTVSGVDHTP
jgi:hypothetical protein